ncbi:MAG: O-antigen ligase family protein [Verrucomicrobiota bacterium]
MSGKIKLWAVGTLTVLAVLAPLKFGTPVVLSATVLPPQTIWEWVFFSWPNQLLTLVAAAEVVELALDAQWLPVRRDWLWVLPGLFLATQLAAVPTSICMATTVETVLHFGVCVAVFYLAARYVREPAAVAWVFGGLTVATLVIVAFAVQQRCGGLAATREYAAVYGGEVPKDLQLRLTSNRVFGTLVYPNALAGYLVVAFAPVLAWLWSCRLRGWLKWGTLLGGGGLMVFGLALTGSRGGFIAFAVMVVSGLVAASRRAWLTLAAVAVIAVVFVTAQQMGLIRHGLASASARGDYWRGAVAIARDHPWLGTGPGTFGSIYPKYKTATTEEAQLVHNSYLQMGSDSGVAGAVVFALLWLVAVRDGFKLARRQGGDVAGVAVLAATTGWVVHGFLDFDLYVPGVAVPAFLMLGVLQGLKPVPDRPARRPARLARGTAGIALGVVVAWLAGRSLLADFCNARTQRLAGSDPVAATASARQAIGFNPVNPRYQLLAGDLAFQQGHAAEAVEFYRAAVGTDPYRAAYHWRFARALLMVAGREVEAVEQLQIAVGLNPMQERYRTELAAIEEKIRQVPAGLLNSQPIDKRR